MIKPPSEWDWQEGPLPDVNGVPDDTRILVWADWKGLGSYSKRSFGDVFIIMPGETTQYVKRRWIAHGLGEMHIKNMKYWTIIEGLNLEELTIKGVIE